MKLKITILGPLFLLGACTYWHEVPITGREHLSGWGDQIRTAAIEAYPYAQMATNAYADNGRYMLDPSLILIRDVPNDGCGFAFSEFQRREGSALKEVIVAFRGTEQQVNDWLCGNLAARQNARGLAIYDTIRTATPANIPVNVTGHSLGGGIATYVSLRREGTASYIFNASPRFRRDGPIPDNHRLSIVELGEFLKIARIPGREAPQTYISINCTPGFGPITQHGIRRLGDCLTRIAAWQDAGARASLDRNNIDWPRGLSR